MTRRCDRCRVEYESGADFGGHDYCMTCYTRVKQEEEQRHARAAQLEQQRIDSRKQQLRDQYLADVLRRKREEDARRLALLSTRKKPEDQLDEMRKRMKLHAYGKYQPQARETQQFAPPGIRKKPPAPDLQKRDERATYAARSPRLEKSVEKRKLKPPAKPIEQVKLSLSVSAGLPVSLSMGQKQVQVFLVGKNASAMPMTVGLEASILDSQKNAIAAKAEPRTCTIEPEGESKIKVAFDLPEDAARGMLAFTALIKENAVYIGRQAAQSTAVFLSSQVKSPMDLQYKQGSALFKPGALFLAFNNVGESGGILEMSSSVVYFSQESIGKKATLTSRTKIKGGEKNILLSFAPAEEAALSRLELSLAGKDSNGKPYSLKRRIDMKKVPSPGEKDETEKTE